MSDVALDYQPYFHDPRLRMTVGGRLLVRVTGYIGYFFLAAAAFTFIFSDLRGLQALGFFLGLALLDRAIHLREADRPLSELPPRGAVNVARYLTPAAFDVIEHSFQRSALTRRNFFLEALRELSSSREIKEGLMRLDVEPDEFRQKAEEFLNLEATRSKMSKEERVVQAEALAVGAFSQALAANHRFITLADLFSALSLIADEFVKRLFILFSIDPGDLERALIFSSHPEAPQGMRRRRVKTVGGFVFGINRRARHRVMNRAWTARPTPTLDRYSTDLTDLARRGEMGFLIGHEEEYSRMVDVLSRAANPNALLVGESGSGKETIVAHLAFNLTKDKVPPPLFDKRLVAIHLSNLVAGAAPEELHDRLQKVVEEIFLAGNVIFYIPDIHHLVKTSGTAYLSAADALMPIISNNLFPIIGTTYPREFKEFLEPRSDFVSLFEVVRVREIAETEAEKLLVYEGLILEKQAGVIVSFSAVKEAVRVAKKYFHHKPLPSSALDLLKDGVIETSRRGEKIVSAATVVRAAERKVNIPIHEVSGEEAQTLLHLEEIIHERLIDQEEAVKAVADALKQYRSGLARRGGPIAAFLFVGPTGVGKTELSKIIAKIQFGAENLMIRFDMSEYQDKQSFFRFIGSPDGKVSGALTDAVLEKPYSLVLLDEFEKAYPDILDLFLQVFEDGRLTDNLGRTVDFQHTIIIATSNAHSDIITDSLVKGESMTNIADYVKRRLTDVFRPELINRFTRIVVFKNLSPADLTKVAALNLKDLASTLEEQGITLAFDDAVVKKIASWGYDPAFGARPIRRVIDEKVKTPLAESILRKEIVKGKRIKTVLEGEEIRFEAVGEGE